MWYIGGSSRITCFFRMQSASARALISAEENGRLGGGLVVLEEACEGEKKSNHM